MMENERESRWPKTSSTKQSMTEPELEVESIDESDIAFGDKDIRRPGEGKVSLYDEAMGKAEDLRSPVGNSLDLALDSNRALEETLEGEADQIAEAGSVDSLNYAFKALRPVVGTLTQELEKDMYLALIFSHLNFYYFVEEYFSLIFAILF
jgi:hypothetical protein